LRRERFSNDVVVLHHAKSLAQSLQRKPTARPKSKLTNGFFCRLYCRQ
jgi:hypothetical protein